MTPDFSHTVTLFPVFNKLGRDKFNECVRHKISEDELEADVLHFAELVGPEDFGTEFMSAMGKSAAISLYYAKQMIPLEEALNDE